MNPYFPADNQNPDPDNDSLNDAIYDFACEEFDTEDPTPKQLAQAEKEYLEMRGEYEPDYD